MAGSFANGFSLGQRAYGDADNRRRQDVLDARATRDDEQKQTALARAERIQGEQDDARARIKGLDGGVFEGSQANFSINDGVAPQGPMPAEAYKAPSTGLQSRKATDLEYNRAFQSEALARGDMAGLQALRTTGKGFEYDEGFNKFRKEYTGAADQIGATAGYVNNKSGRLTMGPQDKNGILPMSVVKSDGSAEFLNLSKQDQATVFAAVRMIDQDPTRALAALASVNKELASAVAAENDLLFKVSKENSDTTKDSNRNQIELAKLGVMRAQVAATAARPARQTEAQVMQEKITALSQVIQQSEPGLTPETATRKAAGMLLKDPNARDKADVGLEAQGLVRINGGLYRQGKTGDLEAVKLPGESATDQALAKLAASGKDPFAAAKPAAAPRGGLRVPSAGDRQFAETAKRAGYEAGMGTDGKMYYSRVVDGQGENLTAEQLAQRLNVLY